jgi:predicted nucleic acid-binding protein
MSDYLLDCNHLSRALRKVSAVRERIHQGRSAGHRFISCYPVLRELEAGIQQTPKPEENRRRLGQLLRHVRLWPLDSETLGFMARSILNCATRVGSFHK